MHKEEKKLPRELIIAGCILVLGVVLAISIYSFPWIRDFALKSPPDSNNPTQVLLGTFGDFWGGLLNPIFPLAAFVLLYSGFSLQRQQLADLRKQQVEDEEINKLTRENQQKQFELLAKQVSIADLSLKFSYFSNLANAIQDQLREIKLTHYGQDTSKPQVSVGFAFKTIMTHPVTLFEKELYGLDAIANFNGERKDHKARVEFTKGAMLTFIDLLISSYDLCMNSPEELKPQFLEMFKAYNLRAIRSICRTAERLKVFELSQD